MKVTIIHQNKRGNAMLTIVHDGISETRHCTPNGNERWRGHWLDTDKRVLQLLQAGSEEASRQLRRFKIGMERYTMPDFCNYKQGEFEAPYTDQLGRELRKANQIIREQQTALAIKEAEETAKEKVA